MALPDGPPHSSVAMNDSRYRSSSSDASTARPRPQRYMHDYAISTSTLGKVAAKAFHNGSLNPHAWRREPVGVDAVLSSRWSVTGSGS